MVDRIRKFLKQLLPSQFKQITAVVNKITVDDLAGLDLKKLQGRNDIYRVRVGSFRIIFQRVPSAENRVIAIERRSETTYNSF